MSGEKFIPFSAILLIALAIALKQTGPAAFTQVGAPSPRAECTAVWQDAVKLSSELIYQCNPAFAPGAWLRRYVTACDQSDAQLVIANAIKPYLTLSQDQVNMIYTSTPSLSPACIAYLLNFGV